MSVRVCMGVLKKQCEQHLDLFLFESALFMAERLYYEEASEDHMHLVATCLVKMGRVKQAYLLLQGAKEPCNRYLFAVCCITLKKLTEAEAALLPPGFKHSTPLQLSDDDISAIPYQAAGLYQLGVICRQENRTESAITYFKKSLQIDPVYWCSFCALCEMGADADLPDMQTYFQRVEPAPVNAPVPSRVTQTHSNANVLQHPQHRVRFADEPHPKTARTAKANSITLSSTSKSVRRSSDIGTSFSLPMPFISVAPPLSTPFVAHTHSNLHSLTASDLGLGSRLDLGARVNLFGTPDLTPIRAAVQGTGNSASLLHIETPSRTGNVSSGAWDWARSGTETAETKSHTPAPHVLAPGVGRQLFDGVDEDEKPSKLRKGTPAHPSPIRVGHNIPTHIFDTNPNPDETSTDQGQQAMAVDTMVESAAMCGGIGSFASVLTQMLRSYKALCVYRCQECVRLLQELPLKHYQSGWVMQQLGRAYFEMGDYTQALQALREMRRIEPYRLSGTEIYSTTLWHLKRDKELCTLAQQVVEIDKLAPQTWCVVGNCFSIQREHETAIKFFERAIQVCPEFTYAYTLFGHELVLNEDLDKAVAAFRHAIKHDHRHYNSWYGLGAIYYRQEKLDLAEYHFRRAANVNPANPVLQCCLGLTLHSLSRSMEALDILQQACVQHPQNAQLRFQKAAVLVAMNELEAALQELHKVQELVPREPPVYQLLGEVCQKLGKTQEAVRYFHVALDLEPKDAAQVKAALERIEEPSLEVEELDNL